ncbi:MAG: hypothetical protein ACRD9Y_06815 [Blastocatellia bacterium]
MKNETMFDPAIWEEFQKQAKKRRRNPVALVTELMREQLEIWEDEKLFREMRRDARKSGYTEDDAVELVRQYRREKRQRAEQTKQRAAS